MNKTPDKMRKHKNFCNQWMGQKVNAPWTRGRTQRYIMHARRPSPDNVCYVPVFQNNSFVNYDAPARWAVYDRSDRQACAHTRAHHQRSPPPHTHAHTFHSFTRSDTGTLNLLYLHSHERYFPSVPCRFYLFLNKHFCYLYIFTQWIREGAAR